jgi:hypothetical protein
MSQEDYRRGLQDVIERLRDHGRLDAILRSERQVKQLLEPAYTNVERIRFLLKHVPDDFDCQAIAADIRARYDLPRDARRTGPRSMPRARCRLTGDAIEQLWRSHRRGRHPSMRVVPINTHRGGTSNEGHAEVRQEHHPAIEQTFEGIHG